MNYFSGIGKPIIIASHPRSGTHLTIDFFRKQFKECQSWKKRGEPLDRLYFALESFASWGGKPLREEIALQILNRPERPIIKTHSNPNFAYLSKNKPLWVEWLKQQGDIYYIIRDGRDVICSFHLFMQSFDPTARCPINEFMRQEVRGTSRVKQWANHVEAWLNQSNAKILRFEDIIRTPEQIVDKVSTDLNLTPLYVEPLLPQRLKGLWHSRWMRVASLNSESTAILGYYRNQKVQKWREVFTESDREFFHQEVGDLLIKLGYEDSEDWISP